MIPINFCVFCVFFNLVIFVYFCSHLTFGKQSGGPKRKASDSTIHMPMFL